MAKQKNGGTVTQEETKGQGRAPYVVTSEMEKKVLKFIKDAKGKGRSIEELMSFVQTTRPTAEKFIGVLSLGIVRKEGRRRYFGEGGEPFVKGKNAPRDPMAKSGAYRTRQVPLQSGPHRLPDAQPVASQGGEEIPANERERLLRLAETNAAILRKLTGI